VSQSANLQRVTDNIGDIVLRFCVARLKWNPDFTADELRRYVAGGVRHGTVLAPDSPSRILRELRRQGRVDYVVVNRAASLYRVVAVRA
jgi:hypothetical protein